MHFQIGDQVRYRPGTGTYGYEDVLEADGRLPGVVVGFSRTRVRVELTLRRLGRTLTRQKCVDAGSLMKVDAALPRGTSPSPGVGLSVTHDGD
jgi:hypothetical protein